MVAVGLSFWTNSGGTEGAEDGSVGAAVMVGNIAETGGSIVTEADVGAGTAAAPGAGVGVGVDSDIGCVMSDLILFGRGELGSEGG